MKKFRLTTSLLLLALLFLGARPAGARPSAGNAFLPLVLSPPFGIDNNILNPSFELGVSAWSFSSNQGDDVVTRWRSHTGSYSAGLGDGRNSRIASIAQAVQVPTTLPILQYWQYVESEELCPLDRGVEFDYLTITIDGYEVQHYDICANLPQRVWLLWSLDMGLYAGHSIQIKFDFHSDDLFASQVYLDDFYFRAR